MTGARIIHDTLEQQGWSVEIADAQKVKGLAPLACKTNKIVGRARVGQFFVPEQAVFERAAHESECPSNGRIVAPGRR
jgi:hypothetical protein